MLDNGCNFIYSTGVQKLKTKNIFICSSSFSERQRKWKEELVEELEWKRGKFSLFSGNYKMQFTFFFLSLLKDENWCIFPF